MTVYSYGEVGHDPPVHAVSGPWQGSTVVSRESTRLNTSLCGRPLSRLRKNPPHLDILCRSCEAKMNDHPHAATPVNDFRPRYARTYVRLGSLFVDPAVQRPMQEPWSKKIAADFSPARFADHPPKVSERTDDVLGPNGERYHIIDGQHEVEGARRAGYGPETMVPVDLYSGLDRKQEASGFLDINVDRKVVRALARFPVSVLAGDLLALVVQESLEHYGWQAKSSGAEGGIACVVQLKRLATNPVVLDKVMQTITGAWGIRPGIQGVIVAGLGRVYSRPRSEAKPCEVDVQHMIHRLKTISPTSVVMAAKGTFGGATAPARAANFVVGEYNKYLRSTPKLDLFS